MNPPQTPAPPPPLRELGVKVDALKTRVDTVDDRLAALEKKVNDIDGKVTSIDARLKQFEDLAKTVRGVGIGASIASLAFLAYAAWIGTQVVSIGRDLSTLQERQTALNQRVDRMALHDWSAVHHLEDGGVDASTDVPIVFDAVEQPQSQRVHHYWCDEPTYLARRGWRGVELTVRDGTSRDGTRMQFLAVPHRGLVRTTEREVPDATAPTNAQTFFAERTEWGWGSGSGHVGLDAFLGSERFCYEYVDGELLPVACRSRD